MKLIFKIAVWVLVGLHLIKPFVLGDLAQVIGICAVIVLVSGLTLMGKSYRKATLTFLMSGLLMLIFFGQPLIVWLTAPGAMTNVIAILVMMQIFSIPIQVGRYNSAVRYWLNRCFKSQRGLFLFTTAATHVFTSFLMFGAIPVMVSLMEETLKGQVPHYARFMAKATSRGYALASLWAPGAINLFLVVQATGVSWSQVFVPGIVLSLLGVLLSYLLEKKRLLKLQAEQFYVTLADDGINERGKVLHIILVVFGLIFFTLLLDKMHVGNSSGRILLAGFIVGGGWLAVFVGQPVLKAAIGDYWENGIIKAGDLAPFFIAMGIFSTALEMSGLLGMVQAEMQGVASWLGIYSLIIIPLLIIGAAILAIHPFITIVMFGKILTILELPFSPVTIALCLALGGSISYMVSPFAGVIMTIGKFVGAKASDVALTWNLRFSLFYFALGICFAYFWGQWV